MLGQRFGKAGAAFDVGLDVHDQRLHVRIFMAFADDVERLHQRHAGSHHRCHLATENGYVTRGDFLALGGRADRALLANLDRVDALAAQLGLDGLFSLSNGLAADAIAPLVRAFPGKIEILLCCCLRHCCFLCVYSTVTRLSSARPK